MKKMIDLFVFKVLFVILFCFLTTEMSFSQSKDTFTLQGECNIQYGLVHLEPIDSIYYPSNINDYTTELSKGKFTFEAPLKYPLAFRIFVMKKGILVYHSEIFYVDKGLQTIKVNTKESGSLPEIKNTTMQELLFEYPPFFKIYNLNCEKYNQKKDSLQKVYNHKFPTNIDSGLANEKKILSNQEDSILLIYTKQHPDSYVALWKVVDKVTGGYKDIYDSILVKFSNNIKKTYTLETLVEKMKTASVVKIGNSFPALSLSDSKQNINLNEVYSTNKLTLVDFWFSDCSPCKAQFPELRRLFENYSNKGFNIIGISVDQKGDVEKWEKTINTNGLIWSQYLDSDRNETRKLSISNFPSNFLLNENGIIIAKNITLTDLSKLLEDNLK
jgi:thiol-disulfide isomerase/thioredoxin